MAQPTRCPKCAYERKPTDTAPDYECPACGVIYSKYDPSIAERRSAEIELKRSELAAQEEAKKKREIEKAQAKFAREQAHTHHRLCDLHALQAIAGQFEQHGRLALGR